MNSCAESKTKEAKAYTSDYYSKIAKCYNQCKHGERDILRKNIIDMLDRVKELLEGNAIRNDE